MLWKVKVQRDKIEGTWVYVSLHKIESPRDKEIDQWVKTGHIEIACLINTK